MEIESTNEENAVSSSLKRKLSEIDADENNRKKIHACEALSVSDEIDENSFTLLDFSDEILLKILLHCDSLTLRSLLRSCKRFNILVKDRTLWNTFDFSQIKLSSKKIEKLLKFVRRDTKTFAIRGLVSKRMENRSKNETITKKTLTILSEKCPELENFIAYEGFLNFGKIQFSDFPASLKHLIFNGCEIAQPRRAKLFDRIDHHLQLLEELSLENCDWFETHDLIAFSKLPHLKKLNLRGCKSLKECVPYASIAARFGFKSLQHLDLRNTPLQDSDFQCCNLIYSLRELYLECPVYLREESANVEENCADAEKANEEDDILTGSEDNDDSSDSESEIGKQESGKAQSSNAATAGGSNQNHFIQLVIQNGNLVNVNNNRFSLNGFQVREMNGLRYMINVANGDGPVQVLHRAINERNEEQNQEQPPQQSQQQQQQQQQQQHQQHQQQPVDTNRNGTENGEATQHLQPTTADENAKEASISQDEKLPSSSSCSSNGKSIENVAGPSNEPSTSGDATNDKAKETDSPKQENKSDAEPIEKPNQQPEPQQQHQQAQNDAENRNENENGGQQRQRLIIIQQRNPDANLPNRQRASNVHEDYITDRGMFAFGVPRQNLLFGMVWIRAEQRPVDTMIERLTLRYYRGITNSTLLHLIDCAPNLQYLDVTGTSVTVDGVRQFMEAKPTCDIVSHHSIEKLT